MRLNPPSIFIFLISFILAMTAIIMKLGLLSLITAGQFDIPYYVPHQEYWLAIIAWLVLTIGTLARGM